MPPSSPEFQELIHRFENNWGRSVNAACEQFFESRHASLAQSPSFPLGCEKNVKYGVHDRHRLDIYWPPNAAELGNLPVVVYFHGGAFRIGDNAVTPHLHANIARFFAANNMIGILGTYRLLPDARFPDGADDITAALTWIQTHVYRYGGDPGAIFPVGHSAGGGHLAMALFSDQFQQLLQQGSGPRGILLLSASLAYDLTQESRKQSMEMYYGTRDQEAIQAHSGLGMLCNRSTVQAETIIPELLMVLAEYDFDECVQGNMKFVQAFAAWRRRVPRVEVWSGHNHVSYCLSIGLPESDSGLRIVQWVRQCLATAQS